jgi:DNA-binding response OmpR family regulator
MTEMPDAQSESASCNSPDQRPTTVLVVEDEPMTRSMVAWMLNRHGYNALTAEDGAQALAISRARQSDCFSVLITDLTLPGMSGIELAAELRLERPELKTLFVSGYSKEKFAQMGVDMSHAAFIAKPFNSRQISEALRALIERQTGVC